MKIPLKYGLLTTLGVAAWVLAVRFAVTNPLSAVHRLGTPIFFNVLQFVMIYLGLKALERENGDRLPFKQAVKAGVGISVVYAAGICVFFGIVMLVVGMKWLASEPGAENTPPGRLAATAFAGLFLFSVVFGLIYSTVISFFIAKRRSEERSY
jgi:uncharacterized membrane protein